MLLAMLQDLIPHNTGKKIHAKVIVTDSTKSPDQYRHGSLTGKEIHAKVVVGDHTKYDDPNLQRALVRARNCTAIAGTVVCGKTWTAIPSPRVFENARTYDS